MCISEAVQCNTLGEDLTEGDMGHMSCMVPYGGTTAPDLHFYDTVTGQQINTEYRYGQYYVYTYNNWTMTPSEDNRLYECRVKLEQPQYSDKCAVALNVTCKVIYNISLQHN